MTNKEKIDFIDDFLAHEENYCHGEYGENCTLSRKYLEEIEKQLTIPDVVGRREQLVCHRVNDNNSNRCINCGVKAGHPCELVNSLPTTNVGKDSNGIKKLKLYNLKKQKKLLIEFGKKVQDNIFKSDKFRTVEDSYEEFKSNL